MTNVVVLERPTELSVENEPRFDRDSNYEPGLLQAARKIYRTYINVHPELVDEPLGVAIDRYSLRGKLIFTRIPALLPQETFIPFEDIER